MRVFRKLVLSSVLSVNLGYTVFLFPLLGVLYPSRVPFTIHNFIAFMLVNSAWGIILATVIYLLMHLKRMSLAKAIMFSIASLWITFWFISFLSTRNTEAISSDYVIITGIDGIAALISWFTLSELAKQYIAR